MQRSGGMATVISIFLQKGGSGKTTTALNFSAFAGARKRNVLLIDMDAQGSASLISGISKDSVKYSIKNVLLNECTINQVIQHCKYYDIIPANNQVQGLEFTLSKLGDINMLKKILEPLNSKYDYIVLDCPPAINPVSITALIASNTLIVPVEPKPLTIGGLSDLIDTINQIYKNHWNDSLYVLGLLMTRYNTRTKLNGRMEKLLGKAAKALNTTVFECSIRECTAIPQAQEKQIPLPDYKPRKNNGATDYNGFTTQVFKRLEGK